MAIKNCFMTDLPMYGYDIKNDDGEVIAKAHLLNFRDKTNLFQKTFVKTGKTTIDEVTGKEIDEIETNLDVACEIISKALVSWELAGSDGIVKPITQANVALLLPEYITSIFKQIMQAETDTMAQVGEIEKN